MVDPLGISPGELGDASASNLVNEYATIPDRPIEAEADRVTPNQVSSGVSRGTQRINNSDGGYMLMGAIEGTEFGIAFYDASGKIVSKYTPYTDYVYDPTTGKNIMQTKKLPDGTYGYITVTPGNDVASAYL